MSRWKQAIEVACKVVEQKWYEIASQGRTMRPDEAIAAIRALPEPPTLSEEELIQEVCRRSYIGEIDLYDPRRVARLIIPIIRSHDCREADEVRDVLREVLECTAHSALNGDVSVHGVVATYDSVHRTDVLARAEKAVKT